MFLFLNLLLTFTFKPGDGMRRAALFWTRWRVWMVESGRPERRELQSSIQDSMRETTSLVAASGVRDFLI